MKHNFSPVERLPDPLFIPARVVCFTDGVFGDMRPVHDAIRDEFERLAVVNEPSLQYGTQFMLDSLHLALRKSKSTARNVELLEQNFGLRTDVPKTPSELARTFSISRNRVSQIVDDQFAALRHPKRAVTLLNFLEDLAEEQR